MLSGFHGDNPIILKLGLDHEALNREAFALKCFVGDSDLHHDNILQNGHAWVVIDLKGVIGEPAYEVSAFIRSPIPELLHHPFCQNYGMTMQRIFDW